MKHNKLHISLYFFLIWSFCFSQQYTNYTANDGLPSNHVYTIVQDAQGFIWFLTDKGMSRYNGNQFKSFTTKNGLPINDVWDAYPTPDGKVWYMSKTTRLGYIEKDTVLSFPNANANEIINPIYTSQIGDSIYLTGPNKTFRLKENQWVGESNRLIENINEDWIKIRHSKVAFLAFKQNDTLFAYNKELKVISKIDNSNIYGKTGMRGQINDSLYFWTSKNNYSILNLNTLQFKQVKFQEALGENTIAHIRINQVDNKLQISGDGFVAQLNKDFEIENPLFFPKNIQAHFGFIDRLNTIWLATFNNGVFKFPQVKRDVKYEFQNDKIQSFDVINDKLVVGVYQKGFYTYNEKEKTFQQIINNKDYVFKASRITELNTSYYSFKNSILKEIDGQIENVELATMNSQEMSANELGRKFIYFDKKVYGTFSFGINKLNPKSLKIEKEYLQKGCNDIISFKNRLLIATTNGLKEIKNDEIVPIIFKNEIFNKSILSIHIIHDTYLLMNTDGFGSYLTDLKSVEPLQSTDFAIVEEAFIEDDNLWLATNSGVLQFIKNKDSFKLNRIFTVSDGLPSNHINTIYVNEASLIVGTNKGVAILPKNQKNETQLLDIYIEEASYNKEDINEGNHAFKYQESNNVRFEVSTIDFSENHTNFSFNYKLEPLHKEWINTTTNSFNYNDLQPGKYTFLVSSNNIERKLSFIIEPLFWQRLWVKILGVIIGICIVALVSRFFMKRSQFKKNQKIFADKRLSELQLKALRSQMNPHFVFNSLAAIQYYINDNNYEASETYLVKFSKLIRQFFELSKENEIVLDAEINLLKNYLDIEILRFKEKLSYTIHVDERLDTKNIKIPTMLLQPIVENAVNHGVFNKLENGLISLHFKHVDNNTFKVEIMDDGVGFVNTKKRPSKNVKSSNVLIDRLHFLNQSGNWEINYNTEEVSPDKEDKGNKSIFIIKKIV